MSDYDFSTLNDKEFEIFVMDLISHDSGARVERYKKGRDGGVDGRFYKCAGSETILQCKHWVKTGIDELIRKLKSEELKKVQALKPSSYIFITSMSLSRNDKKRIYNIFQEFMENDSSVLGQEDLNDTLSRHKEVERRHYKLWLSSSNVLRVMLNAAIYGRTEGRIQDMIQRGKLYVPTENHSQAIKVLEETNSLIVTGEPGSGKSTLAEQICLELLSKGYELFVIADDLKEAESVYDPEKKQLFYFDDFLGRNYLQAIERQKDSSVINFIQRVGRTKTKKFILTSRTNILTQGFALSDHFKSYNLEKSRYEIRVDTLSRLEKARILYNHIWYGNLTSEYMIELYRDKRYHLIIKHQNFNPRLISFLVDLNRVKSKTPATYWKYIGSVMNDPADVWQNLFDTQIDENSRSMVKLVVFNGGRIAEELLQHAYERHADLWGTVRVNQLNSDFFSISKLMVGSLLNRSMSQNGKVFFDLFNPSISDFVMKRFATSGSIDKFFISLQTVESLKTLHDLHANKILSTDAFKRCIYALLKHLLEQFHQDYSSRYIVRLGIHAVRVLKEDNLIMRKFVTFFLSHFDPEDTANSHDIIDLFLSLLKIKDDPALLDKAEEFLTNAIAEIDVNSTRDALDLSSKIGRKFYDEMLQTARKNIVDHWRDQIQDEVYTAELFSERDIGYVQDKMSVVQEALDGWLDDYGIEFTPDEKDAILRKCDLQDIEEKLQSQYDYDDDDDRRGYYGGKSTYSEDDQIDDLFDEE